MASNITLSAGVRQNLLSLQSTASMMAQTQNRLATGKKVNSALDNPTNFFTSASLQGRASDMGSLLDAMSNGIKTLEAADNGLSAITKTVESMQSTLRQARQDKSFKSASYSLDPAATGNISFSGGSVGATAVNIGLVNAGTAVQASVGGTTDAAGYTAPVAGSNDGTQSTITATNDYVDIDLSNDAGDQFNFDITLGADTANISLTAADGTAGVIDIDQAITAIQDQLDAQNVAVTVGKDGAGTKLTFTANTNGAVALTVDNGAVVDGGGGGTNNHALTDLGIANLGAAGETDTGTDDTTPATSYSFTANGTAITLNSTNAATLADAVTAINQQLTADGNTAVTAGLDNDGNLVIRGAADGSSNVTLAEVGGGTDAADLFGATLTSNGTAGTAATQKTVDELVNEINGHTDLADNVRASNDNGKLRIENLSTAAMTVGGVTTGGAINGGTGSGSIGGNDVRKNLVKQFNELRDQLNKLADDASFNGVNLLRGDKLKITFNETGTSTMEIQAKKPDGAATSINATNLDIDSALDADFDSDTGIDTRLDTLQNALNTLRSQSSSFGSNLSIVQNRQDFTKSMINTLQTGADNLVLADSNEEGANLLALQTRQQLSTTALSLSAQADQAVLRLF